MGNGVREMNQLLTANVATNLYWLGRYLERIELTLFEINKAYDKVIDVDKDAGVKLYNKFGIDIAYTSSLDFLSEAIRGDHEANLVNLMVNARENAIISRTNIDLSSFGKIIELHELLQKMSKTSLIIDYKDMDTVLSLLYAIWGTHEKKGQRKGSIYFLKLGKLVEEVDFRLRFNKKKRMTNLILKEIQHIFKILDPDTSGKKLRVGTKKEIDIMEALTEKIDELIILD